MVNQKVQKLFLRCESQWSVLAHYSIGRLHCEDTLQSRLLLTWRNKLGLLRFSAYPLCGVPQSMLVAAAAAAAFVLVLAFATMTCSAFVLPTLSQTQGTLVGHSPAAATPLCHSKSPAPARRTKQPLKT